MKKKEYRGKILCALVAAALALVLTWQVGQVQYLRGMIEKEVLQEEIANSVLRLHIRANSNSVEDQKIKIQVKQAVIEYLEPMLAVSSSKESSIQVVQDHLEELVTVVYEVLKENGFSYCVRTRLGYALFPEKTYGAYTFPSGTYQALIVSLGTGYGQNWWCMLYPGLCFLDQACQAVNQDKDQELQEILTEEAFQWITNPGEIEFDFLWF